MKARGPGQATRGTKTDDQCTREEEGGRERKGRGKERVGAWWGQEDPEKDLGERWRKQRAGQGNKRGWEAGLRQQAGLDCKIGWQGVLGTFQKKAPCKAHPSHPVSKFCLQFLLLFRLITRSSALRDPARLDR